MPPPVVYATSMRPRKCSAPITTRPHCHIGLYLMHNININAVSRSVRSHTKHNFLFFVNCGFSANCKSIYSDHKCCSTTLSNYLYRLIWLLALSVSHKQKLVTKAIYILQTPQEIVSRFYFVFVFRNFLHIKTCNCSTVAGVAAAISIASLKQVLLLA